MMILWGAGVQEVSFQLLEQLLGLFGGLFIGWFWGQWQGKKNWKRKEFRDSLMVSLNAVEFFPQAAPGEPVASLKLRTLFQRDLPTLLHNQVMRDSVQTAMKKTSPGNPLLRFSKDDSWFILNAILNQIAEQFAQGEVKAEMGLAVTKRWYTFCLTYEKEGEMRQWKPRALLFDREKFLAFPNTGEIELESPHHQARVATIRSLKQEQHQNPHLFMEIELSI